MARYYSNVSKNMTLSGSINNTDVTMTVSDATGLPVSFPFFIVLDAETSSVEIVSVTAAAGNLLTITRGQQDTTAKAHSIGATAYHAWTALDGQDAQTHYAATSAVHGTTGAVVGTTDTQTLTNKSISGATNTLSAIPGAALTGAITVSTIAVANVTGDWPIDTRSTGSLPIDTRTTGNLPIDTRSTGSIPVDTRTTGNLPLARTTGTIPIDTQTSGTLPGSRVSSAMNHTEFTQDSAGSPAVLVTPHSSPTAPAARVTSHTGAPGLQVKRNNSTTSGETMFEVVDDSDANLFSVTRTGDTDTAGEATIRDNINWGDTTRVATTSDRQVTGYTTTSSTYTESGAAYCGVAFRSPPSGQVLILFSALLDNSNSTAGTLVSPGIRTGSSVGSGTPVLNASDEYCVKNAGTDDRIYGSFYHANLTPNTDYNATLFHRVNGNTGTIANRQICVMPCL